MTFRIAPVTPDDLPALAALLVETVAAGGSVSYLHPLPEAEARTFWEGALADMAAGGRVILGAYAGERLAATVSLLLAMPPNQPHRAEIAKLMTAKAFRGRGAARELMREAEVLAAQRGKRHLMLDTAEEGGAAGLYEALGYTRAGRIPEFALLPQGGLSATLIFWKELPAA